MTGANNLGNLYYTLDLDDKEFERKMKEKADKYGVSLTIKSKIEGLDTKNYFQEVEKSSGSASRRIKDDMERNIPALMRMDDRLKQLNKWYTELERTSEAAGRAQEKANEKALRSAQKLAAAQKMQQTRQSAGQFKEYIQSLSATSDAQKQMSAYYKELEQASKSQTKYNTALGSASKNQRQFANAVGLTNKTLFSQRTLAIQLSNQIGTMFSIYAAERFITKLAEVRGEFEMQQVSLRAILQDAQAADQIFSQIKQLAVVSPFEFKDLVGYTKQLSAFSVPVEELYDTMKSLADISSGLGVDMGRIILAYGQVRSASVLRGQELRQFTEAGIPLVDELAKKFAELRGGIDATGKAIKAIPAGEVFDLISQRAVPFEMVKEVFDDLTSEGGKFYKMQEKQAESLKGKIANLADSYAIMLNEIGEANDGILKGGVEALSSLMDNWKELSRILLGLIATYGTFKAMMIATNAVMAATRSIQMISWVINLTAAMAGATKATAALSMAQKALVSTPIGLFATALAALVGGLIIFNKEAESTSEIIDRLNKSVNDYANSNDDLNRMIETYETLSSKTKLSTEEQGKLNQTMQLIGQIVPGATKVMDEYGNVLSINIESVKAFAQAQEDANKQILKDTISAGDKRLLELRDQQRKLAEIVNTGVVKTTNIRGETIEVTLNAKRLEEYRVKLFEVGKEAEELAPKVEAARKKLNGISDDAGDDSEKLQDWAKRFNKQLKSLDISQYIIDQQSIKKAETTFEEFKKSLLNTYKDIEEKLKRREQAPELFSDDEIKSYRKQAEEYKKIVDLIGGEDIKEKKGADPLADKLKSRIDLTKEAYAEYEKLRKLYSEQEAFDMVQMQEGFKGIDISKTKNELVKNLQSLYTEGANLTSEKGKKVLESLMKDIRTMIVGGITDDFDQAINIISKKIEEQKGKYDLYRDVLGLTGDKTVAFQIAFEGGEEKFDTYIEYLKAEFEKVAQLSGLKETSFDKIIGLSDVEKSKLPNQVKSLMDKIEDEINSNKVKITIDAQNLINQFASVQDKITTIEKKGIQERLEAKQILSPDMYESYEEASFKKQEEAITKLKGEMLQLLPVWEQIFGETQYKSYDQLVQAANKAKEILKNAKVNYDSKTNKPLSFTSFYEDENGEKVDIAGQISLLEKLRKQFDALGEARIPKNPFKEFVVSLKELLTATEEENEEAPTLSERLGKLGATAAASADMIGAFASELSGLFDALGNEGVANVLSNVAEGMQSISNIGQAFAKGGVIGGIAAAAGETVKWITKIFQAHDRRLEKQIKNSENRVKKLGWAYADLERVIDKSLGQEKYNYTDDQLKNLAEQQKELYEQAALEEKKKKADDEKVADLRRQAVEVGQQMEDLIDNIVNDITGGAKEIAKTLGDAFFEAFAAGEDYAVAWADTVKDLVADIARQKLIEKYLEPEIDKILEKNSAGWFNGNTLDITKLLESMPQLKDDLLALGDVWGVIFEQLAPELKDLLAGSESAGEGLAKGIQGVTEDTANLLASLLNAIRQDVSVNRATLERIAGLIGTSTSNSSLIQANVALIQSDVRAIRTAFLGMISGGHPKGGDGLRVFIQ